MAKKGGGMMHDQSRPGGVKKSAAPFHKDHSTHKATAKSGAAHSSPGGMVGHMKPGTKC